MLQFIALHLWQSTLFLAAAWMLAQLCRHNGAAIRYWIWFAASMKFLVPFALLQAMGEYIGRSLPTPPPISPMLVETAQAILAPVGAYVVSNAPGDITIVLATVWIAGASILLLRWLLQWRAMHRMVAAAREAHMDASVPIRVISGHHAPAVFGVFRPVIVVPRAVVRQLDAAQLKTVLAHEMSHVDRRDNLTAALHKLVEVMFWFYPPIWWIGANLLREREAACDEAVIEQGYERDVYAASILQVCRMGVAARFFGAAASTGGTLVQRMRTILSHTHAQPITQTRHAMLLAMAIFALYGPFALGIVTAAAREASTSIAIRFESVALQPAAPAWRSSKHFDSARARLSLKNVSIRDLISTAYPASRLSGEMKLIDQRYDIDARWRRDGEPSERNVYRELLANILSRNTNLRLSINQDCAPKCEGPEP